MTLNQRILGFVNFGNQIGKLLDADSSDEFSSLCSSIIAENGWFTQDSVRQSLTEISKWCSNDQLKILISDIHFTDCKSAKKVLIICAGNIPAVSFHDLLCVVLSGNKALLKLSTSDSSLMKYLVSILINMDDEFKSYVHLVDKIEKNMDAVIATGSNNTSRYFEYYFKKYPTLLRKSRTSIAILNGNETDAELELLGHDIFSYFGLGCRNITKIYIPESFDIQRIFKAIYKYSDVVNHNKYYNNYQYQKSIYLLNNISILDNEFVIFKKDKGLKSPIGVVYYEPYEQIDSVLDNLIEQNNEIQCIVSANHIKFGGAQEPTIIDFADDENTLKFLTILAS